MWWFPLCSGLKVLRHGADHHVAEDTVLLGGSVFALLDPIPALHPIAITGHAGRDQDEAVAAVVADDGDRAVLLTAPGEKEPKLRIEVRVGVLGIDPDLDRGDLEGLPVVLLGGDKIGHDVDDVVGEVGSPQSGGVVLD